MPESWAAVPIVFIQKALCPHCRSAETPAIKKSLPTEADGSKTRQCECLVCHGRFLVVIEPPDFGGVGGANVYDASGGNELWES
jgi:hypothetical protein